MLHASRTQDHHRTGMTPWVLGLSFAVVAVAGVTLSHRAPAGPAARPTPKPVWVDADEYTGPSVVDPNTWPAAAKSWLGHNLLPLDSARAANSARVCGSDSRRKITDTKVAPFNSICQLELRFTDGIFYVGTGFIISPRLVLTAGHNVFDSTKGGWIISARVIPGRNGINIDGTGTTPEVQPYGSQFATKFFTNANWLATESPEFDYGVLVLPDRKMSRQTGSFPYSTTFTDAQLTNLTVTISGYPTDKVPGFVDPLVGFDNLSFTQWQMSGQITGLNGFTNQIMTHNIDTDDLGQAGSPVFRLEGKKRTAIGIHIGGQDLPTCQSFARRIDADVQALIDFANAQLR